MQIFSNLFKTKLKSEIKNQNIFNCVKSYFHNLGRPIWSNKNYENFAKEGYIKNVIVYKCISMISKNAANVPFVLYKKTGNKKEIIKKHELIDLLNRPNPMQSKFEFLESLYSFKLIAGNSYIKAIFPQKSEYFKNPKELFILRPDRITVIAGGNGLPIGYKYTVNSFAQNFYVNSITGKSEILHLKSFHPIDDWYGLSPIESASYSIDQHNEAGQWNQAMLQNGARPSGALIVKNDNGNNLLTDEQFLRLKNQLNEEFAGSNNAGKPLLLEGGLDWKEMSLSPQDMDFLNIKNSSARDIALAFGVPTQLLGIPGDNTYNNMAEAKLSLWEQTIIPFIENIIEALNSWLVPMFEDGLELSYDKDSISPLALRRDKLWERIGKAEFLNDNEKREILGLDRKR
jgi:HK97 family phage portal protein